VAQKARKMEKNRSKQQQPYILRKEKSTYLDIFQKRSTRIRIYETLCYGVVLFSTGALFPSGGTGFQILAIGAAVLIIGGGPFLYRQVLQPEYMLTKTDLVIRMRGKERSFPLEEVERTSKWRAIFRLKDKKESIMASNAFLEKLDEQLAIVHNQKKR